MVVKQSLRDRIDKTSMREDGNSYDVPSDCWTIMWIDKTSMREDGNPGLFNELNVNGKGIDKTSMREDGNHSNVTTVTRQAERNW